jgi:tRNA threonylcarbamoyladenosine biosynthesis protein TsaB
VYWAVFERAAGFARALTPEAVATPARVLGQVGGSLMPGLARGAGSGFAAYPELAQGCAALSPLLADLAPHAREIALLAQHDGLGVAVPAEQAQPVYVRNDVAVAPTLS